MSPFDLAQGRTGLEACRRTIREVKARFADSPACALGYFPEGRGDHIPDASRPVGAAASFLGPDRGRVVRARGHSYSTRPQTYSGTHCVYLPSDSPVETAGAAGPTFDELVQVLTGAAAGRIDRSTTDQVAVRSHRRCDGTESPPFACSTSSQSRPTGPFRRSPWSSQ